MHNNVYCGIAMVAKLGNELRCPPVDKQKQEVLYIHSEMSNDEVKHTHVIDELEEDHAKKIKTDSESQLQCFSSHIESRCRENMT